MRLCRETKEPIGQGGVRNSREEMKGRNMFTMQCVFLKMPLGSGALCTMKIHRENPTRQNKNYLSWDRIFVRYANLDFFLCTPPR